TIVLMLIGGIIFVNSGGLLVVGAYAIRISFSDILSLTFLYAVYAVIKSLLGVGKGDYNKIKKLEDRYKRILDQLDGLSDVDDDNDLAEKKRLENELKKLEKKLTSMGVSADQIGHMKEGQPIHYGRYGNHYGDPYGPYNHRDRRRLR
ncbi:MAG: hypothetical protein KAJ20_04480, partial [Candidatus Aenigmarchaeota archaeon]|nr:hypothetical protein [Candidatus Aenigmarchaeota archaeon]